MTYQEMQERLTKVETLIKAVQQPRYQNTVQNVQETLSKLSTIKENLENKMKILAESEEPMFVSGTDGVTKVAKMSRKEAEKLKRNPNITGIDPLKGQPLKEDMDLGQFSDIVNKKYKVEEHRRGYIVYLSEENKDQYVIYNFDKNKQTLKVSECGGFYIDKTKAEEAGLISGPFPIDGESQKQKFTVDKNEGSIPISGEKLLELIDHVMEGFLRFAQSFYDDIKGKQDLDEYINEEEKTIEVPEGYYYLRIKKDPATQNHIQTVLNDFLGIDYEIDPRDDEGVVLIFPIKEYNPKLLNYIDDKTMVLGSNIPDFARKPFIQVVRLDYGKAYKIINEAVSTFNIENGMYDKDNKLDALDFETNDPASGDELGEFKFTFDPSTTSEEIDTFIYDTVMSLEASGIPVYDHGPVLDDDERSNISGKLEQEIKVLENDLKKLEDQKAQLEFDQEEEAEPKGGPIADKYSRDKKKIEKEIEKKEQEIAKKRQELTNHRMNEEEEEDFNADDAQKDDEENLPGGYDDDDRPLPMGTPDVFEEDLDYYKEHHDIAGMEVPADDHDDLDIGHQDDEPDMLKQTAFEIAMYGAKLYKQLNKYDKMGGEVDFPNWWQSKVILAKDYISKAQHYLDFEDKQPIIDKLALEGKELKEMKVDKSKPMTDEEIVKKKKENINKLNKELEELEKEKEDDAIREKKKEIKDKINREEIVKKRAEKRIEKDTHDKVKKTGVDQEVKDIQETKISKKRFKELLAEAYYEVIAEQEAEVNTDNSLEAFFDIYGKTDPDKNNPEKTVNPIIALHGSKEQAEQELERAVTTNPGGENFTFKLKGGQEYDLYKKDGDKGMWTIEIRGYKHTLDASGIKDAQEDLRILSKEAPTPSTDDPAGFEDDASGGADPFAGGGGGGADIGGGTGTGGGEADTDATSAADAETQPDTPATTATGDSELEFD